MEKWNLNIIINYIRREYIISECCSSSKVRPQDPGGGAAQIAVPREAVDMEMRSPPVSSFVEPQSVPSRISVVLVEEAEVRGA